MMNKLAIGILSLRRYGYLKQLLDSLARNPDKSLVDFYLFQDGATNPFSGRTYAQPDEIERCVQTFKDADLPHKEIVQQKENIGIPRGTYLEFTTLFGQGYEYVTVLPSDMVAGKYFLKTLLIIYPQFRGDPKAGILRTGPTKPPYQEPVHTYEQAKALENKVSYGFVTEQDLGIWRECWLGIKPGVDRYHELIKGCDFTQLLRYIDHIEKSAHHLQPTKNALYAAFGNPYDDIVHQSLAAKQGYQGLYTLTPRIKSIGAISTFREGYEPSWRKYGLERITLWDIGNVESYELVQSAHAPVRKPDSGLIKMIYAGPMKAPFSIRGDKSRKFYARIYPNKEVDVSSEDIPFLEKQGFRRV